MTYSVRDGKAAWQGRLLSEWVPYVVELIVDTFNPVRIILFGSVAEGTDGPDSDLDFLVVLDEAPVPQRRRLMTQLRRATRMADVPRDLLVTSARDFEANRNLVGTTEYRPANHGVVVYERAHAA